MLSVWRTLPWLLVPVALAQQPLSPATGTGSPFLSIPHFSSDTLRFGGPLAKFAAKDLQGHTWRSEDLKGKFTLICLWSTRLARDADKLGPDASETIFGVLDLAEVQRFYEEMHGESNLQVLTISADFDATETSSYMKEKKYTFPVIVDDDWHLRSTLFPREGLYYWVVNPEGRLSYPVHQWSLGRILIEMKRAAGRE
ncbi:MAG TPA: hypothetical protein VME43_23525 [Bryobacteraceae bacterium]|nr:hypothetical protein [Bryobacteraceae bacterium]